MVPKERREDELDQMIRDRTSKPAPKKKEEDFESVMGEVLYFESAATDRSPKRSGETGVLISRNASNISVRFPPAACTFPSRPIFC